jgi:hypothetical protein
MSTRCTINFTYGGDKQIAAKIYRHSDGYPDGVLPDIQEFFAAVEKDTKDTRFANPTYLAAKFVVWQADQFARSWDLKSGEFVQHGRKLDFLSLGVCMEDPGDIEFTYFVDCKGRDPKGRPTVTWRKAGS